MPTHPAGYLTIIDPADPWPTFRRDQRNTGASPLPAVYRGDEPWAFQTGKGVFSTPVIDAAGIIYVGSADHTFYALNPDGTVNWQYQAGEIIDSAAALTPGAVTFIAGDGKMYHFRTGETAVGERRIWEFQAQARPGISYNRWFEGNVAVGPDGTFYAGNTNFLYYAIQPDGSLKWTYATGSNNWSAAACGPDGTLYWGSLDTLIRAVRPDGQERWRRRTLGFVAASAAVGADGTVYIGSFDSNLYALDGQTGKVRWKFPTGEHIYASAALDEAPDGETRAILFGSADGRLYAVDRRGKLLWAYDTGDPIRSSPALGLAPDGEGKIVYFGNGSGKLYALDAADGRLRWVFDTTPEDPELADRNDLNGSPALGQAGIYIGGEHGQVWYVPYDYPIAHPEEQRGSRLERQPDEFYGMCYVSPGGSTRAEFPRVLPSSAMLTLRLMVRKGGQSVPTRLYEAPLGRPKDALVVTIEPPIPFVVDHSADGQYVYIRPGVFFKPGQDYTLHVSGRYYTGGLRLGNLPLGGREAGKFESRFQFRAEGAGGAFPLQAPGEHQQGGLTAFEWTRLAAPIPPMLPSLNQIGFDYIDWLVGPALVTPPDEQGQGRFVLWAIGARRLADGSLAPDPESDFTLPLSGVYQGADFIAFNRDFPMPITGIRIPFKLFELRGAFQPDGTTGRPAAFAATRALGIPTFGPYLVLAGLANDWFKDLLVAGTFVTRGYTGAASHAPAGIRVTRVNCQPATARQAGWVEATFAVQAGQAYPAAEHRAGVLLVDADRSEAVNLDYRANLATSVDAAGDIESTRLTLPPGTQLPKRLKILVMLDIFPAHCVTLQSAGSKGAVVSPE